MTQLDKIDRVVTNHFNLEEDEMFVCTARKIVEIRQIFYYMAIKVGRYKHREIAEYKLWRDHGTIIHGVNKIQGFIDVDPQFRSEMEKLEEKCHEEIEPASLSDLKTNIHENVKKCQSKAQLQRFLRKLQV